MAALRRFSFLGRLMLLAIVVGGVSTNAIPPDAGGRLDDRVGPLASQITEGRVKAMSPAGSRELGSDSWNVTLLSVISADEMDGSAVAANDVHLDVPGQEPPDLGGDPRALGIQALGARPHLHAEKAQRRTRERTPRGEAVPTGSIAHTALS